MPVPNTQKHPTSRSTRLLEQRSGLNGTTNEDPEPTLALTNRPNRLPCRFRAELLRSLSETTTLPVWLLSVHQPLPFTPFFFGHGSVPMETILNNSSLISRFCRFHTLCRSQMVR